MYSEENIKNRLKRDLTLLVIVLPILLIILAVSHWREVWAVVQEWWK